MRRDHATIPAVPARLLPTAQCSQHLAPLHSSRAPQRMTQSALSSPTHRSFALRSAGNALTNGTSSGSTSSSSSSNNSNSTASNGDNRQAGSPSNLCTFSSYSPSTASSLLPYFLLSCVQQASLIPSTVPPSPSSPMPSSLHSLPYKLPSSSCKATACACACTCSCRNQKAASALPSPPSKDPSNIKHSRHNHRFFPGTLACVAVLVFLLLVSNYLGHVRPVLWSSGNRARLLGASHVDGGHHWKLRLGGLPRLVQDNETRAPREWEMLPEEPQLTFVPEKKDHVSGTVMMRGHALQEHEPREEAS